MVNLSFIPFTWSFSSDNFSSVVTSCALILKTKTKNRRLTPSVFCYNSLMNLKSLINQPIKNTVIILLAAGTLLSATGLFHLASERELLSSCNGKVMCINQQNREPINIIRNTLSQDIILVSRIAVEISLVLLIVQVSVKLAPKKK